MCSVVRYRTYTRYSAQSTLRQRVRLRPYAIRTLGRNATPSIKLPREQWQVVIPNAHVGYINCQEFGGDHIDGVTSTPLLESVAPPGLEVALDVLDEIAERIDEANALRLVRLERCCHDAELARRRFIQFDPDNRLVANTLEANWNDVLRELDELQQSHDLRREADSVLLDDPMRERIMALAKDFSLAWDDRRTQPIERRRMVALLIEDVTLAKEEGISIHIRFRGDRVQSLKLPRLMHVKRDHGLKNRYERLRARGFLTHSETCKHHGVSNTTIYNRARTGLL